MSEMVRNVCPLPCAPENLPPALSPPVPDSHITAGHTCPPTCPRLSPTARLAPVPSHSPYREGTGDSPGTAPHPERHPVTDKPTPGRRARASAAREAFQTARNRGLVRRHAARLQHLADRGLADPVPLADLKAHLERGQRRPRNSGGTS